MEARSAGVSRPFCFAAWSQTALSATASRESRHQPRDAEQVVGGTNKVDVHLHSLASAVASFAQPTHCLHPAEGLLDPFTYPLTGRITRMVRGTRVERRASGPREILCHVRGDLQLPTRGDKVAGVITLVPAQSDSAAASQSFISHRDRRAPLGSAVRRFDLNINEQAVAVLSQCIGRIAELGLFALTLAGQQCLRVSGRLMSVVGAALSVEVHRRVARIIGPVPRLLILPLEALKRGPCLNQRPVHREVLTGEQLERSRLLYHPAEELSCHLAFQKPLAVGGKAGMIETRFVQLHIQKPAEQQVIFKLLAEQPFAADRIQRHQQRRFEQPLGRNRRSPDRAVHPVQYRRQLLEHRFRQLLDPPKWMPLGNSLLEVYHHQHRPLPPLLASHPPLPPTSPHPRPLAKTNYTPICFRAFSTAC